MWWSLTGKFPDESCRADFVRFLEAGWKDLGFPAVDSKGEPRCLRTWFSERLSKERNLLGEN
jgi:hypothetical protein